MRLSFDTIDEVKDFVKQLKGTRGGKDKDEGDAGNAPIPLTPPAGGAQPFNPAGSAAFAPPAGGAGPAGAGPFAAGAPSIHPDVQAIVGKINLRIDATAAEGRWNDQALTWFRSECVKGGVAEAAAATVEQIKGQCLYKLQMPQLAQIAQFMGVQ